MPKRFLPEKSKNLDDSASGEGTRASKLYKDAIKARESLLGAIELWDEEETRNEGRAELSTSFSRPDEGSYLRGPSEKIRFAENDDCMIALLVYSSVSML